MALPDYFKFRVYNDTGQQLDFSGNSSNETFVLKGKMWKFDGNGALTWSTEQTFLTAATDLADDASEAGSEINNSSNKYLGVQLYAEAKTDNASANGNLLIQIEFPTNGAGGTYPSAAASFDGDADVILLGVLPLVGAQTRAKNFTYG